MYNFVYESGWGAFSVMLFFKSHSWSYFSIFSTARHS